MSCSALVHPVRWPDDEAGLALIDTSFTTEIFCRVHRSDLSFRLVAESVDPPLYKSCGMAIR